jgi:hypothetical protein
MRMLFVAAVASTLLACSSSSAPGSTGDASAPPAEDASTAPCLSLGGTCVSYQTACPVLQQNTALCGDSVLICCLPADDAGPIIAPGDDSGTAPLEASTDAAGD